MGEEMESTERSPAEEKEGWSPAMVSSPEATMLEDTGIKGETEAEGSSRDGGASPLLEERLKPDGDEMHDRAVEGGRRPVVTPAPQSLQRLAMMLEMIRAR